jgi:AraC-like DNA-binding protein
MARRGRLRADDSVVAHAEQIFSIAEGSAPPPEFEEVSVSWQRCASQYGVDPTASTAPRILTSAELHDLCGPIEPLVAIARGELDALYKLVRPAGYTLLLCDRTGVAVEHRGEEAQASQFKHWGIWLGGVWSESVEGTNGIGTCIAEGRPVTIHRSQHFRSRHIGLSCSGAPIFDVDGSLLAVLDVSACDPALSEGAHTLTGALTTRTARAIDERFFRERFRHEWIVALALSQQSGPSALLAVDAGQRIAGANRVARTVLKIDDDGLRNGISFWQLFKRDGQLFRRTGDGDLPTRIVIAESGEECPALVTPPESWLGASNLALHTRPRSDLLSTVRQFVYAPPARGGLSPATMGRVRDYVEAHLGENLELADLAAIAGLSVFHFAREFKNSAGVAPHYYLMQKRVELAQRLLAKSDLTLSEIALAAGFSDQSHLARRFRQIVGITPREFRLSR